MCFAVRRGETEARLDPQYLELDRRKRVYYATPAFPLTPLRALCTFVQYGSSERANTDGLGVRMIRMNNLQASGWDFSDLKHIELDDKKLEKYRLEPGDLLFNRTNSKELVGKCEVFQEQGDWVFASYLIRVRLDTSRVLPGFVSEFLNCPAGRIQIDQVSRQIAGMSNVNAEELKDLEVPLPPLAVQRQLLAELEMARTRRDEQISNATRMLSQFESWALKRVKVKVEAETPQIAFGVRKCAVSTRLDPFYHAPAFSHSVKAIEKVPHAALADLVTFSNDQWKPSEHPLPAFRYIEISGVDRRRGKATGNEVAVIDAPSRARMAVQSGDIIVSLTRPHHGSIALLDGVHDGCVASTGFAIIRGTDSSRIQSRYLWVALRFSISLKQMLRRSSGGNYPAITQDELGKVLLPVPALAIQDEIVAEAINRNTEADKLEAQAAKVWADARAHFERQLLKGKTP